MSGDHPPSGLPRRPYWSERQGRHTYATFTPTQARRAFAGVVAACDAQSELQEAFGYDCVDEGEVPGTLGTAIEERLLTILGREDLWPIGHRAESWDDDTLFDMMEFLHDHVSTPVSGRFHDYSNCGFHGARFTPEPARSNYRSLVSDILRRMDPGYEMTSQGEIIRAVPDGVAPLLDTAPRQLELSQRQHVEAAITKYRARSSTRTDRRDAVRDLADVLEHLRDDVKATMPSKDEAMLFEMANRFWIRHNRPGEHRDYDHDAWWSWLFYVYLASIALVTHLADRDSSPPSSEPAM
ncbi:hypothetical protein O2W15_01580 [Modestobacter sp. VKM Ac-2979]|uniref:hypothetical protein n=1 Tax=unclassified Modestobacter TaxID=2643866 RepID=UPI0022ABB4B4|nr:MULTISPECIES: hypothetical protein [unclassified Modestobacter]MCZ2810116.1 hypothetical protein [Modestobacter sp. VKM Ac-2979]MCZ2841602.1 hypothetical protein [Modestobacter sp. VKM Ac-2980]